MPLITTLVIAILAQTPQAPQAALPDVITADALGANFNPDAVGKGTAQDFDFLVGAWDFRFQQRADGGGYAPTQPGVWTTQKSQEGFIVEDVWRLGGTNNPTITYRIFNPSRELWEIQGTKPRRGGWDSGVAWSQGNQRYLVQYFNNGQRLVRIKYYDITETSFKWRADGSDDKGKTWTPDIWKMEATRRKTPGLLTVDANVVGQYNRVKSLLTRSADRMPADAYEFKPSAEMRTFSGSLVHAAATNFGMCANLTGKPSPKDPRELEKSVQTKDEAIKTLAESFQFCDEYVKGLTAAQFGETYSATSIGPDGARSSIAVAKGGLLANLVAHNNEMYGYTAVYLRLKGLVPPSSDPPRPPAK